MLKSFAPSVIRLRGVRHNNLKNFDLDLPVGKLIVITGLSGSGKSSLAFDTLFAEGQRRYIETFSPYARQFFDRMDKPKVDSIDGIPPAIAIEQRNSVRTTRSTVGTMTEICDYMKALWPHIAQLHCRQCGQPVRKDSPQMIWQSVFEPGTGSQDLLITFDLPLSEKLSVEESLALIARQGYQRLLLGGEVIRLDELTARSSGQVSGIKQLTVVQDRLKAIPSNRARFIEACEQAYHFGKGKLAIRKFDSLNRDLPNAQHRSSAQLFSNRLHCAQCDIEYREPSPALFSFNNPVGACPTCRGFGRIISIDYNLALPDRSKSIAGGVVKPWQVGHGLESQNDLLKACRHFDIPTQVPFEKLPKKWQAFVLEGDPEYGSDEEHEWPRAWYGVKGYFRWLESKAYKMHVRVLLSRYRCYTTCPDCEGRRFQPEALLYLVSKEGRGSRVEDERERDGRGARAQLEQPASSERLTLADFYLWPIRDAFEFIERLAQARADKGSSSPHDPIALVLSEVRARLGYLNQVGLGYLTLDRPTRSLSGGETERVNLTTCLGTRLVNTLFVLDEPSVGLHPRDTERLVRILQRLRDAGNTVVVVEHEASVMKAADQIVDLGPGHGLTGGQVVFQGSYQELLHAKRSLTGQYLSEKRKIELPERRPVELSESSGRFGYPDQKFALENEFALNDAPSRRFSDSSTPTLRISHASKHNLRELTVRIPLQRFVCVTGVSGSGKTTLVREVLLPALQAKLNSVPGATKASDQVDSEKCGNGGNNDDSSFEPHGASDLEGWENLARVILVDQSILAKTPRSNPAVYIGAFDDIREFFAQSEPARQQGLNASAFSFNSSQGHCERCRGAGFEKIEMQFLSDVFIRCPECDGRRYRKHILDVKVRPNDFPDRCREQPKTSQLRFKRSTLSRVPLSIAELLDSTVEEAIEFLDAFPNSRPACRAADSLRLLVEVGLGYLKLGQPINTLSGGESQRLKLVRHLAESNIQHKSSDHDASTSGIRHPVSTLFLFDEPTTGLHFHDVEVLLKVFQRLVDGGHSVLVIEHNLDVIKSADWVIDLGPDAGDQGGRLVAEGPPEDIAACAGSPTGQALRTVLPRMRRGLTPVLS